LADIEHLYGNDLTVDSTGDLAVVDGTQLGTERVIRRLMTSQGQYIFQPDYGAGLPSFIGLPGQAQNIAAVIQQQMQLEDVVSQVPLPAVNVQQVNNTVTASIQYVDAETGESAVLTLPIATT